MKNDPLGQFNPLNILKQFSTNSTDDETKLTKIIDEVSRYDIYDFISRVSSLNLVIENQNKSIVFDALIAGILSRDKTSYKGTAIMSSGKFKRVIEQLYDLTLFKMIDPSENIFIERVRYYGNYWIFSGINYAPSYCLQGFIDSICLYNARLNQDFSIKANKLINFILNISNQAAVLLGYDVQTIQHKESDRILIPSASRCNDLRNCIIMDYSDIEKLLDDTFLLDDLFSDFECGDLSEVVNQDKQEFFYHPFIKTPNNSVIILNPSILVPYLIHNLILLADKYKCKDSLINAYNDIIWHNCRRDLRSLGHQKIDEQEYGIQLINTEFYKETILTAGNDKVLFFYYICDAGKDYIDHSMFTQHDISKYIPKISKRINLFIKSLPKIEKKSYYCLFVTNGLGRTIAGKTTKKHLSRSILLSPLELHCVSVNERKHPNFIPKYIDAKSHIDSFSMPGICSELNAIETYTQHDYSFYLSDDFNPKTTSVYFAFGDSLDYLIRAFLREDRHLVEYYDGKHLAEVILSDPVRNIYYKKSQHLQPPEPVILFDKIAIWFSLDNPSCIEEANVSNSLVDAISYWLAESKAIINQMNFTHQCIRIHVVLTDPIEDYYKKGENTASLTDCLSYDIHNNIIKMHWNSDAYATLDVPSNSTEKEMIISVINELVKLNTNPVKTSCLDSLFSNPLKKKVFSINAFTTPFAIPTLGELQTVTAEDENQLLDEIGTHFLQSNEYTYGKVPDEQRYELTKKVVAFLYGLLQSEVSSISPEGVYERVCFDLETAISEITLAQKRYAYDITCYPESAGEIFSQFNEANKSSVALKFFAEYIAATPPTGTKPMGIMQYDRILAICHLIVDWAYKGDTFRYNIENSSIHFLDSGRIGMSRDNEKQLAFINSSVQTRKLEVLSDPSISVFSSHNIIDDYKEDLNNAFVDEYGFSFEIFISCILSIIDYGETIKRDIKRVPREKLVQCVSDSIKTDTEIINKIIDQISLQQRPDFLTPPAPFKNFDVYPWRFNRELSFTRRPIIQYKDDLIWGNRQLEHMWRFTIDLIVEGKYKARNSKLKKLIGKMSNRRGNDFNDAVYEKISLLDGVLVYKKVSKINGKKIALENGNTLGDVDVLCIIPEKYTIIAGEAKDFSYAKNPYEIDQEYNKIFVDGDDGKETCYLTKHKRRVSWLEKHLDDIISHYRLSSGPWVIKTALFVSEEIVSNKYYHKNETVIIYSDISESTIKTI